MRKRHFSVHELCLDGIDMCDDPLKTRPETIVSENLQMNMLHM